jgi:pimeloyl-ACP methyl ester carboxylesterase
VIEERRDMSVKDDKPAASHRARPLAAIFSLAALLAAGSCSTPPRDVSIANVDGHAVAYRVLGAERPVLVMISGLGDGMSTFEEVAPDLAAFATVIVYDRSGYGGSELRDGIHDAAAADRELSALLAQSGVRGPYVLLGHSLGGLFAEYYAARHPDQISGLILEDSRPAGFLQLCQSAGVRMCAAPSWMMQFAPAGARQELAALSTTSAQVDELGAVQGKPVLILSRSVAPEAGSSDAVWAEGQDILAARYADSQHLVASESGHYLHHDQEAWFVASVRDFLAAMPGS